MAPQNRPISAPGGKPPTRRVPRRRLARRAKDDLTYGLARSVLLLLRRVPLPLALRLGELVGALVFHTMPSLRRMSRRHLGIAFGDEMSVAERDRVARRAVMNAARSFCEVAKFDVIGPRLDDYVEVVGGEVAERVLQQGDGAIVVTGHLGNWEMLAAYFAHKGLDITAVARRVQEQRLNALLVSFRERNGVHTILRDDPAAARHILRTLKRRGVLAMLVDQDTQAPSLTVPFLGHPARTPVAPAALSVRSGLPLIPIFIERRAAGGHRITIHPPLAAPKTGARLADIRALVVSSNRAIEEQIRRRPEEWVWWHRRWRRAAIPRLDLDEKFQYAEASSG